MIAAIMINYLLKKVQKSSHGVVYIYCNYKGQQEQNTSSMLAAILKQLVLDRPSIIEPIERLQQQYANKETEPLLDDIFSAIQDVLAYYPTIYVVIDGLDECRNSDGTRRQFLAKLRNL